MTFRLEETPIAAMPRFADPPGDGLQAMDPALRGAFVEARGAGVQPADRLALPGALAVTTGQQPGLLGGPIYAVHKALSAAALAAVLERAWRRPVVPVFWVAGDDHDHAEVASASWLDEAGALVTRSLGARDAAQPQLPMYRTPLAGVGAVLAALADTLRRGPGRDDTLEWVHRHWREEATVAGAFGTAMAELLAPHGVAVLDPTHAAAKRLAVPVIRQALQRAADLDEALVARERALRDAGRGPGVPVDRGATLVMLEGRDGRDRLLRERGEFVLRRSGERWAGHALDALLEAEPGRFSANVLLRPVVERQLLPTVAYVGGPGELRYLPLAAAAFEVLGLEQQRPVPRWSGFVVEPQVERVLAKFGATLDELRAPNGALERRVVGEELPVGARQAMDELADALELGWGALAREAGGIDPTLVRSFEGRRTQALEAVARARVRLVAHLRRRRSVELAQVERARTLVQPDGQPQERLLGPVTFLARHGSAWTAAVGEAAGRQVATTLEAEGSRA